jgi:hypothetical protein
MPVLVDVLAEHHLDVRHHHAKQRRQKRTMWSVALPPLGLAVTLTLSCVLGLPMASWLALDAGC